MPRVKFLCWLARSVPYFLCTIFLGGECTREHEVHTQLGFGLLSTLLAKLSVATDQ